MLRYWTAPSPTKTRETPHCLAKTLPFPLTPKAKSATTTTTTTLWVLWYIFSLNNKPLFYSYSDFVFVLFGKLLARNTYCLQTLFYTCDTSRRYNPTIGDRDHVKSKKKTPWKTQKWTPYCHSQLPSQLSGYRSFGHTIPFCGSHMSMLNSSHTGYAAMQRDWTTSLDHSLTRWWQKSGTTSWLRLVRSRTTLSGPNWLDEPPTHDRNVYASFSWTRN